MVATEHGGYRWKSYAVKPGKLVVKLRSRACLRVESAVENREAWANATSSAGLEV